MSVVDKFRKLADEASEEQKRQLAAFMALEEKIRSFKPVVTENGADSTLSLTATEADLLVKMLEAFKAMAAKFQ